MKEPTRLLIRSIIDILLFLLRCEKDRKGKIYTNPQYIEQLESVLRQRYNEWDASA